MNYNDYKEIMEYEKLEESESVRMSLERAMYWQRAIKSLTSYDEVVRQRLTKEFEEEKIKFILSAIDMARFEKRIGCKCIEEGDKYIEWVAEERIKNMKL